MRQVKGRSNPTRRTIVFFVCFVGLWALIVAGVRLSRNPTPAQTKDPSARVPAQTKAVQAKVPDAKKVAKPPGVDNNLVIEPVEEDELR